MEFVAENSANHTNNYFQSYEDLEVHQLMLQDRPRNEAYYRAIINEKEAFKNKVVLDVGTGTGILAIFCAQAGAAKVYAVEASNLYKIADEVVKENNFENIIEVIHGRVEEVDLPQKVDIIVSEWMGFYLVHEGMLDSVILVRDKFLKDDGLMFPESATLYCAPCSVPSMYDFWDNVNGISMQCVGKHLRTSKSTKPDILQILPDHVLSDPESIAWLDLKEVTLEELNTINTQQVTAATKSGRYQGIALWFVCQFPATSSSESVVLSTDPSDELTHWKQTVIVLPSNIKVDEGTPIAYDLCLQRSSNDCRKYNIEVTMLDPETVVHPEPCRCHMTKCILIKAMLDKYEEEERCTLNAM